MKLESQVTSLDLSKRLKELGVKQESLWYWWQSFSEKAPWGVCRKYEAPPIIWRKEHKDMVCSAFTVAELGEMLPHCFTEPSVVYPLKIEKLNSGEWDVRYSNDFHMTVFKGEFFQDHTEANARAKMLIHLIEKGLVKI